MEKFKRIKEDASLSLFPSLGVVGKEEKEIPVIPITSVKNIPPLDDPEKQAELERLYAKTPDEPWWNR
jgi:hypothetical protein